MVLQTRPGLPGDGWIRLVIDKAFRRSKAPQHLKVAGVRSQTPKTFFVDGLECTSECDPESWNPSVSAPKSPSLQPARASRSLTSLIPPTLSTLTPQKAREKSMDVDEEGEDYDYDQQFAVTLQDLGFATEPAHSYRVSISPDLTATDGQTLGYSWMASSISGTSRPSPASATATACGKQRRSDPAVLRAQLQERQQWTAPVSRGPAHADDPPLKKRDSTAPPNGVNRTLAPAPERSSRTGWTSAPCLRTGKGLVWAAVKAGEPIPKANRRGMANRSASARWCR